METEPFLPRRRGVPKNGQLEFDLGFCYRFCVIPAKAGIQNKNPKKTPGYPRKRV